MSGCPPGASSGEGSDCSGASLLAHTGQSPHLSFSLALYSLAPQFSQFQ